jgi:hypothetical protein
MLGPLIVAPVLPPWFAVLFGINAELDEMSLGSLSSFNPVDIVVLPSSATTFAGCWPGRAGQTSCDGSFQSSPLAGIPVLFATSL